jgi:predicted DNA-binding transcriptional regulator AlpA
MLLYACFMQSVHKEPLLIDTEVADILKCSVSSVRKWRLQGRGPRFFRLGALIRYKECDVLDYVQSGRLYKETGIGLKRKNKNGNQQRQG